jgi:FkbM family methyltransferase
MAVAGAILQGWRRARAILCLGSLELAWMRSHLPWTRSKLVRYVNSLAPEDQAALAGVRARRTSPAGPGVRFLWIGRWVPQKGVRRLVAWIAERAAVAPHDTFTVAGCGLGAVRDLPRELLTAGRVRVVESFRRDELPDLLAGHDAGVFTSEVEGWGLSLNEMLESGLPVFATGAGGVSDLRPLFPRSLRAFPPAPDLGADSDLSATEDLESGGYLWHCTWDAIAAAYERDVLPRLAPPPRCRNGGRLLAGFWRFGTFRLAERLFAGEPGPRVLPRPFFGHTLPIDVSRSSTHRLLYLEGERFLAERHLLLRLLRPGMRVADVGANIGYYALLFARAVGPEGAVVCCEPEPDNLVELQRALSGNALANVRVLPVAVGNADGEAFLAPGVNGRVSANGGPPPPGTVAVPLRRLDTLLPQGVDFLKIDVEGYEGKVLDGAERLLREHRPVLFVELHPAAMAAPHSVAGIVETLAPLYRNLAAYVPARQEHLGEKLAARYLPRAGVRRAELAELLAACREGRRHDPFWLVAEA